MKIEGSGSISQRHGSADPDPDSHQNVMDPQHCLKHKIYFLIQCCVSAYHSIYKIPRCSYK
jgi:hypothetical protein